MNAVIIHFYFQCARMTINNISTNGGLLKIFKEIGFKTEIQTHLQIVNFLDVTFNLATGTYRPYKKANDPLLYISTSSKHPPQVIKQLTTSFNEWLNKNPPSEIFNASNLTMAFNINVFFRDLVYMYIFFLGSWSWNQRVPSPFLLIMLSA